MIDSETKILATNIMAALSMSDTDSEKYHELVGQVSESKAILTNLIPVSLLPEPTPEVYDPYKTVYDLTSSDRFAQAWSKSRE